MIDKNDIEELLESWNNAKMEMAKLEKLCDKYKSYCDKIMNKLDKNTLSSSKYTLKRKEMTRSTISKKDLPKDIWNKYCNESSFSVFYLKENKN
jgi:hypothetical protein